MIAYADLPRQVFTGTNVGYIAGAADGIVIVQGKPARRPIYLFEVGNGNNLPVLLGRQVSLINGHYLFMGLDPSKQYLIICRDHERQFEPAAWDYVTPATDLSVAEQQALWESWQTQ